MKKEKTRVALSLVIAFIFALSFSLPVYADDCMTKDDLLAECKKEVKEINCSDAKKAFDCSDFIFLDCRTEKEFKKGSIPNALHLDRGLLEFKIDKVIPDKDAKIVVYCKTGGRSLMTAHTLKRMGYRNVNSMNGGWQGWVRAGYPVM